MLGYSRGTDAWSSGDHRDIRQEWGFPSGGKSTSLSGAFKYTRSQEAMSGDLRRGRLSSLGEPQDNITHAITATNTSGSWKDESSNWHQSANSCASDRAATICKPPNPDSLLTSKLGKGRPLQFFFALQQQVSWCITDRSGRLRIWEDTPASLDWLARRSSCWSLCPRGTTAARWYSKPTRSWPPR